MNSQGGACWREYHHFGQDWPWKTAERDPPNKKGVPGDYVKEEPKSFGVEEYWVQFKLNPGSIEEDRNVYRRAGPIHNKIVVITKSSDYFHYEERDFWESLPKMGPS